MSKSRHGSVVPKPVRWMGTSKQDLTAFPDDVKRRVGRALWDAQIGLTPKSALALISRRLTQAQEDYESWRRDHGVQ